MFSQLEENPLNGKKGRTKQNTDRNRIRTTVAAPSASGMPSACEEKQGRGIYGVRRWRAVEQRWGPFSDFPFVADEQKNIKKSYRETLLLDTLKTRDILQATKMNNSACQFCRSERMRHVVHAGQF